MWWSALAAARTWEPLDAGDPVHRLRQRHVQAALLGAIAYFVLPFDFMPDVLPVLGFTDDAAVLATAIRTVASHIRPDHRDAARAALQRGLDEADA